MAEHQSHMKLFRRQALDAAGRRGLGPVQVVSAPGFRSCVAVALIAVTLLAGAVLSIEIPERITAVGVLMPEEGMLPVRAPRAGVVDRLQVSNGARVRHGQVVLTIGGQRHAHSRASLSEQRIASLRRERDALQVATELTLQTAAQELRAADVRVRLEEQRLESAYEELRLRTEQDVLARQRLHRTETLLTRQLVAAVAADEQTNAVLATQAAKNLAEQRVLGLRAEIASLRQSYRELADKPALIRARADIRDENLQRELALLAFERAVDVTAPDTGVVAGLTVREGAFVSIGQTLLTVYQPGSDLEARIYLRTADAGRVVVGQTVELQLPAFPHQYYGTLRARVSSVSAVPVAPDGLAVPIGVAVPVFEIRAELSAAALGTAADRWRLPAGAPFEVNLIRQRWPLYRWLLRSAA